MRIVWILVGVVIGAAIGLAIGFCGALIAASFAPAHNDGTYGMREMLICLPLGLGFGVLGGITWGVKHAL